MRIMIVDRLDCTLSRYVEAASCGVVKMVYCGKGVVKLCIIGFRATFSMLRVKVKRHPHIVAKYSKTDLYSQEFGVWVAKARI